jgi:hypothetical protein
MTGRERRVRLCDGCFQAATGLLAECEDGCPQDTSHSGLCLRASPDECQWCGTPGRLHEVSRADVGRLLPTVGEEHEGLWFLHWADGRRGPYASAQAAWDDWHAQPCVVNATTPAPHRPGTGRSRPFPAWHSSPVAAPGRTRCAATGQVTIGCPAMC